MGAIKCRIRFFWDNETEVWIATSDDVPGLVLESESLDDLLKHVKDAVPELLFLNDQHPMEIDFTYDTERNDRVLMYG